MSFRLVPKSVTLNDLERQNGPYFVLFSQSLVISEVYCVKAVDKAILIKSNQIYFAINLVHNITMSLHCIWLDRQAITFRAWSVARQFSFNDVHRTTNYVQALCYAM